MDNWHCYKCRQELKDADILLEFMEITQFVPGLKCPSCGKPYFVEATVVDIVKPGEDTIESKFT